MKKLAFCLVGFLAFESTASALDCVPSPAKGDCVVLDDGTTVLSPSAIDKISIAVEKNSELTRQIAAMTVAYTARTAEAVAWNNAVVALQNENVQWGKRVASKDERIADIAKKLEASESSITKSPWLYVGIVTVSLVIGSVVTYEMKKE